MELDLMGLLGRSVSASSLMDSSAVVEDGVVDVKLELSLGLSSGEMEPRKRARENDEAIIVKKPKLEGSVPYLLQVMPMVFLGPIGYCYAYIMPCWVPTSMEFFGNNMYEPRDNAGLALEMHGVAANDWQMEIARESSSPKCQNYGTSILQLFC
ncbi:hypothetical protein IEQ34_000334 [Dendrobium chrysotoxum]|uniref:Uncharacterized protein n=1 Tax=Dendrobium chrysotoxum TaxID=161865 RepID=A0AAV7H990_DENCH|nr:hypothetical protein IEQ34_000077 [Dendrobium chrysotoxum]KAH0470611.1 hypothetical protein IEQ34_000334 [Dendrobium chrysotoxum]